ncbi:MAG: biotin-independent malonate decarboxylase subunit beta [Candidatus Acidiferrales bacterium]
MNTLNFQYAARDPICHRSHVGVVSSGDLEVLLEPSPSPHHATVTVCTSVDGYNEIWKAVLDRFFFRYKGAVSIYINDFGATPGMVLFRLEQAVTPPHTNTADRKSASTEDLPPNSFIELNARERARTLLDPMTFHELLGPFDRIQSPWLSQQGIVPQSDDGVIIARGTIEGEPAVVIAIEGSFQGGSIGEVSGSKIAGALDLACKDSERGLPIRAVLLMETGGVRLQEANIGLEVISEVHAAVVALRQYVPVIGVIAGMVGCFGGMAITASLCSYLIMTRQARLGMNGPEVIEQEAGSDELDSSDRHLIWSIYGGQQRYETGFVDALVEDDAEIISNTVREMFRRGLPAENRITQVERYQTLLDSIDTSGPSDISQLLKLWRKRGIE